MIKKLLCIGLAVALLFCWVLPVLGAESPEYRTWLQSDSRWGSITFGTSDTMSKSGCAITSIAKAMVHSGAASTDPAVFNPGIYCRWLKANGGITPQGWIVWSKAADYSKDFSYYMAIALSGTKAEKTALIQYYLDKGYVAVVAVKNGGHYVAVDKVSNGTVYILDSAKDGYTKLFSYDAAGIEKMQLFKGPKKGGSTTTTTVYDTSVQAVGVGTYTITSDNGVNLRAGAGTSYKVVTAVPYEAQVKVTKVSNGWGYTTYNGFSGWLTLEFAKLTENTVRGLKVTPPTKTTYEQGEKLDTTGMKVTALYANGDERWVSSVKYTVSGFSSAKAGTCKVYVTFQNKSAVFTVTINQKEYQVGKYIINSSDGVNLRSAPSTDGDRLGGIPFNAAVKVTAVKNNWGKTTYNGMTGWFCLDYADMVGQTGLKATAKVTAFVKGQSVKATDFTVKRVYGDGSTVTITDFTYKLGTATTNYLPITITDGSFSVTLKVKRVTKGDCNADFYINSADALATLQAALGNKPKTFVKKAADVDGDGKVLAIDSLLIMQETVGKSR